jgi:hypothetical protein
MCCREEMQQDANDFLLWLLNLNNNPPKVVKGKPVVDDNSVFQDVFPR